MQAGEECGFHGNPRKAELWVSVPALHCTGPRLSAALLSLPLSLQPPPLYLSLPFTTSLPFPAPPHLPYLPPSCDRGSHKHTRAHTHTASYVSYKHTESMCLQPASPSHSPLPSPLILTPPPPPPTALVLGSAEKPMPAATVLPCAVGRVVMGKECEYNPYRHYG